MTYVNAEQFYAPIIIGVNTSILPDVTIDEASLTWSSTFLSGTGEISYGNDNLIYLSNLP